MKKILWYQYILIFIGGVFLANFVPHFVNGISGNPFPSPLGDPPGFGKSSPLSNVLWGCGNLLLSFILLRSGKLSFEHKISLIVLFAGIVFMSILLSQAFSNQL